MKCWPVRDQGSRGARWVLSRSSASSGMATVRRPWLGSTDTAYLHETRRNKSELIQILWDWNLQTVDLTIVSPTLWDWQWQLSVASVHISDDCQCWLSVITVSDNCQWWLSVTTFIGDCQWWLPVMTVSDNCQWQMSVTTVSDLIVWVLTAITVLCSLPKHFTLAVPFSTQD